MYVFIIVFFLFMVYMYVRRKIEREEREREIAREMIGGASGKEIKRDGRLILSVVCSNPTALAGKEILELKKPTRFQHHVISPSYVFLVFFSFFPYLVIS